GQYTVMAYSLVPIYHVVDAEEVFDDFCSVRKQFVVYFFFNDTATTEIYTLSLHDALPISMNGSAMINAPNSGIEGTYFGAISGRDRKSTRLNSSHLVISYAVFCLKKKKQTPSTRAALALQRYCHRRRKCAQPRD